jgi:serine/threonine protein kinase
MPPEVCQIQNGQYSRQGRASDIWSLGLLFIIEYKRQWFLLFSLLVCLGVLLFEMIFGYRPFEHIEDNYEKMSFIARLTRMPCIPMCHHPYLHDILTLCLQINPIHRPNAEQLLQHPFFRWCYLFKIHKWCDNICFDDRCLAHLISIKTFACFPIRWTIRAVRLVFFSTVS